jgi:hypothetical protein
MKVFETDFLSREQVKKDMLKSEDIQEKAKNNTKKTSNSLSKSHLWISSSKQYRRDVQKERCEEYNETFI